MARKRPSLPTVSSLLSYLLPGYCTFPIGMSDYRPQYWEIYQLKEVVGISLTFMAVDMLGGVFSFLSLFFRPKLDIVAFVSVTDRMILMR
jgi:hypothetical protein